MKKALEVKICKLPLSENLAVIRVDVQVFGNALLRGEVVSGERLGDGPRDARFFGHHQHDQLLGVVLLLLVVVDVEFVLSEFFLGHFKSWIEKILRTFLRLGIFALWAFESPRGSSSLIWLSGQRFACTIWKLEFESSFSLSLPCLEFINIIFFLGKVFVYCF